ncbi:MAG: hypothetical protein IJU72_04015, partial [Bacteroidales bacterium]|nr:hypothetical protein [Bacteroidales bacterium]
MVLYERDFLVVEAANEFGRNEGVGIGLDGEDELREHLKGVGGLLLGLGPEQVVVVGIVVGSLAGLGFNGKVDALDDVGAVEGREKLLCNFVLQAFLSYLLVFGHAWLRLAARGSQLQHGKRKGVHRSVCCLLLT